MATSLYMIWRFGFQSVYDIIGRFMSLGEVTDISKFLWLGLSNFYRDFFVNYIIFWKGHNLSKRYSTRFVYLLQAVWPDVIIKIAKVIQKLPKMKCQILLESDAFQNSSISNHTLGIVLYENLLSRTFKNSPIWSYWNLLHPFNTMTTQSIDLGKPLSTGSFGHEPSWPNV